MPLLGRAPGVGGKADGRADGQNRRQPRKGGDGDPRSRGARFIPHHAGRRVRGLAVPGLPAPHPRARRRTHARCRRLRPGARSAQPAARRVVWRSIGHARHRPRLPDIAHRRALGGGSASCAAASMASASACSPSPFGAGARRPGHPHRPPDRPPGSTTPSPRWAGRCSIPPAPWSTGPSGIYTRSTPPGLSTTGARPC
jgi:hypothetical protein